MPKKSGRGRKVSRVMRSRQRESSDRRKVRNLSKFVKEEWAAVGDAISSVPLCTVPDILVLDQCCSVGKIIEYIINAIVTRPPTQNSVLD
mmetsp:Transcript_59244/g.176053  ORF Transcript_59244/g.176053 Transcript_59244/m.176053 type:complete len:90 (+) Transcript_59244:748-1017(+)